MNANRFNFVLSVFAAIERGYFDDGQQDREEKKSARADVLRSLRRRVIKETTTAAQISRACYRGDYQA
jgi:hypothetical protein